jgi:hypothetical protein
MNIFAGIVKSQLPGIVAELKKEAPALIKQYLPKLIEEHKAKLPEYIESLRKFGEEQLREALGDADGNDKMDFDEYVDDAQEAAGHLHALSEIVSRVEKRMKANKEKLMPVAEVEDAKAAE